MIDVSIIIPCYNHGAYLKETLQSIRNCEPLPYKYEVIVVNDGSTDENTLKVLKEIENEGYIIIHQKNQGLGATRNNAIKTAKGRYILPLDSDNMACRPYLTSAIDILEKEKEISIVYGDAAYFGEKSGPWIVGKYNLQKLMLGNYIDACAVFRKEVWSKIDGYDEKIPVMGVEDWDFWLRASFSGFRFHYINEICFNYRVLASSMLNAIDVNKMKLLNEYFRKKYNSIFDKDCLNEMMLNVFKLNKKLVIKLFLAVYFPRLFNTFFKFKLIGNKKFL